METLTEFLRPELLVLIPVLYLIGMGLKKSETVPDRHIPALLGAIGIILATVYIIATEDLSNWRQVVQAVFTGITQGVLCAGASVFVNQIIRQGKKRNSK